MLVALCQGVLKLSVNLGAGRTELSANNVVMNEWNSLSVSRYMLCVCVCMCVCVHACGLFPWLLHLYLYIVEN